MNRRAIFLIACCVAMPAFAAQNLVENGTFDKGQRVGDEWLIDGWHARLTDFMPETIRNADGARSYQYVCGCGHSLGAFKPWCGLRCPKCGGFISGEECGDWYLKNHTRVSLGDGRSGRGIYFKLPTDVGSNQGVRVFSRMIQAKPGWGYKLSFDTRTKGSIARVFVECYRYGTQANYVPNKDLDPYGTKTPIERSYRAHVNAGSPANWEHFTDEVVAPKRYRFDWMSVKLYAYMPGEAWFDNVVLVPMTAKELDAFISSKPKPKDDRFEY